MNVLKERRKRRTERNSGGSAESCGSNYGSQNTNEVNSISTFFIVFRSKIKSLTIKNQLLILLKRMSL